MQANIYYDNQLLGVLIKVDNRNRRTYFIIYIYIYMYICVKQIFLPIDTV